MIKNNENFSFAFFGTPDVASKTLGILKNFGFIPKVIITNPDRPKGRGLTLSPSPVAIWATEHNIPCLKPEKIDEGFYTKISDFNVDIFIVVAYGKIFPQKLIDMPKYKTLNIHYSLLPKYRGASPLEQALLNGDTETGVSIQQMVLKMDQGPIIKDEKVSINLNTQKEELKEILIEKGGKLLANILPDYIDGKIIPIKQDESLATYCSKIEKSDGEIDLNDDQLKNWNKYRAYSGWPGVFFFKDSKRIKITRAKFENKKFIIERIIPEGKHEQDYLL